MLSKIIDEKLIRQLELIIGRSSKIVLVVHENPDGDAIGSLLGMYHFLKSQGKEVRPMIPNDAPANLQWLPGFDNVVVFNKNAGRGCQLLYSADLILMMDLNTLDRTGRMADAIRHSAGVKCLIDHHIHPQVEASVVISHPEIASTCELVFRYVCRTEKLDELSREAATCIYTGMMTDTGNFSYNSCQKEIYLIIYSLLEKGIDKDWIYRKVNCENTLNRMRMKGYVLSEGMEMLPEYKTVIIRMPKSKLDEFDSQPGDTDGLVNMPLDIQGVVFSAFLREESDIIRLSFRSTGNFPVNRIAAEHFEGGGHLNAAGGRFRGSLEEARALLLKVLPSYVSEL